VTETEIRLLNDLATTNLAVAPPTLRIPRGGVHAPRLPARRARDAEAEAAAARAVALRRFLAAHPSLSDGEAR
jgi:hypothetical protein